MVMFVVVEKQTILIKFKSSFGVIIFKWTCNLGRRFWWEIRDKIAKIQLLVVTINFESKTKIEFLRKQNKAPQAVRSLA